MDRKVLLVSLLAVVSMMVLASVSAIAVFALTADSPVQTEAVNINEGVEVAPAQVEASEIEAVEPAFRHENVGYAGKPGGCTYNSSAQLQLTQAPSSEKLETDSLAQVPR